MDLNSLPLDNSDDFSRDDEEIDKIDEMLFQQDDNKQDNDNKNNITTVLSVEKLEEKLHDFQEKIDRNSCSLYPEIDLAKKLSEMEREASSSGMERIAGTINDLEIKLDHLLTETRQTIKEEEFLSVLQEEELTKTKRKKIQKKLTDLEESYEERLGHIWEQIEDLERKLDETQVGQSDFRNDDFSNESSFDDYKSL